MSGSEFWTATPREIRALFDRAAEREQRAARREDERFGLLAAVVANAQGGKQDGGMFTPADFFPSLADGASRAEQPEAEAEPDDLAIARSLMAFGARGRNLYRAGLGLPAAG